jgi:hypothetical protein
MTTADAREDAPPPPTDRGTDRNTTPATAKTTPVAQPPGEKGGAKGPEPTRFGDWEKNGRCFDF